MSAFGIQVYGGREGERERQTLALTHPASLSLSPWLGATYSLSESPLVVSTLLSLSLPLFLSLSASLVIFTGELFFPTGPEREEEREEESEGDRERERDGEGEPEIDVDTLSLPLLSSPPSLSLSLPRRRDWRSALNRSTQVAFVLLHLTLFECASASLELLSCSPDPSAEKSTEKFVFLESAPFLACTKGNREYEVLWFLALVGISIYVVIVPLLLLVSMYRRQRERERESVGEGERVSGGGGWADLAVEGWAKDRPVLCEAEWTVRRIGLAAVLALAREPATRRAGLHLVLGGSLLLRSLSGGLFDGTLFNKVDALVLFVIGVSDAVLVGGGEDEEGSPPLSIVIVVANALIILLLMYTGVRVVKNSAKNHAEPQQLHSAIGEEERGGEEADVRSMV
jgi:hypothetical protein